MDYMGRKGGFASLLPEGVHSPRVAIEGDRLKIGFKYGEGFWSTVVWVELKVWLEVLGPAVFQARGWFVRTLGFLISSRLATRSLPPLLA